MNQAVYRHTQIGWLMLIALGAPIIVIVTLLASGSPLPLIQLVALGVLVVSLLLFPTLTVIGDDRGLDVRFGPGVIHKRFRWNDIDAAAPVRNSWLAGWGIRWIGTGWMYNVSGLSAVELSLSGGKRFRIGTDDPERLTAFIEQKLRGRLY